MKKEEKKNIEKEIVDEIHILEEDIKQIESKTLKIISGYDYHKITIFVICIVAAYFLFNNQYILELISNLNKYGYFGILIAGILFPFGFASIFSAGFFIILNPSNIYLASFIGGIGAVIGDLFIFHLVRFNFMDEFEKLENKKAMKTAKIIIDRTIGKKIQMYLMFAIIGILIASPLPDEIGVMILAGLTKVKTHILASICFIMHFLGILILFLI